MSLGSDIGGGFSLVEAGFDYTKTLPTTVTGNATSNTVGAYVDILTAANNTSHSSAIKVIVRPNSSGTQGDILINIATGAAASEVDIFQNLWIPSSTSSNAAIYTFDFPVAIPAGVRISANCQGSSSSKTVDVSLQLEKGKLGADSLSVVDTYGAVTATTDGVTVNSGGTINNFGSLVELIASTDESYSGFIIACHKKDGSMTDMSQTYDVAIGAAASEEIIFSGHQVRPDGSERVQGAISPFVGVAIPAGVRIAIRVQSTSTNADANMDFIGYFIR